PEADEPKAVLFPFVHGEAAKAIDERGQLAGGHIVATQFVEHGCTSGRGIGPRQDSTGQPASRRRCAILRSTMSRARTDAEIPAPFDVYRDVGRPEWIDHNRHMNMGYYLVVFDYATDEWLRHIGLDEAHRDAHGVTTFCLEAHVTYHREAREGDPLRFTTWL